MFELLQYEFVRNAIIAGLLTSVACGIIGVYIIIKRLVFISGGISHASFGGIGLGYFLGINPVVTLLPFSIVSAISMYLIERKTRLSGDTAIGILWAAGMASGILFIYLTPGYAPDLMTYLFGNILTVPVEDILLMAVLDLIIVAVVGLLYKEFLAICFDEEFASITGVKAGRLYLLLLCLIAMAVVSMIRVVGIILVIALLTIPAAISRMFLSDVKAMMLLSIASGAVFTMAGLWLSYLFDLPSGSTIVLTLIAAYVAGAVVKRVCAGPVSGKLSAVTGLLRKKTI